MVSLLYTGFPRRFQMLIGEFASRITPGNRTALPKKLRVELGERIILTRGFEGCVLALSLSAWEEMASSTLSGPLVSPAVRDTARFLLGGAHEVVPDGQGRVVIPPSLREYAQIEEEVVIIGLGRWVEIWSRSRWLEREKHLIAQSSVIAEQLLAS